MRALVCFLAASIAAYANTYCVTVAGLGGEPDYEQRFSSWAREMDKILKGAGADVQVQTLHGEAATRDRLRSTLAGIAKEAKPDDTVVLMLIGHGTFDGSDYKINVPGPDITATDLAAMLDRVPAQRQLVVNMTSASGASVHALQKPTRTVITATKSGTEKNATIFARYWVEALRDAAADTDKNEVISALEAYTYAQTKTKQFYETQKRLATEHSALDGGNDPQSQQIASRFPLLRIGSIQLAAQDPAKKELLGKREQLERQIDDLKLKKATMPTEDYKKQLSVLLLDLARTQQELDK